MDECKELLNIARDSAHTALHTLAAMATVSPEYSFQEDVPREVKTGADRILEAEILRMLIPTGLPVLSEEAGELSGTSNSDLRWIVDPLDGTINYVHGVAPCAVSIALYQGDLPIFGVIGEFPSLKMAWGGPSVGAYFEGNPISVSSISEKNKAILCTGFPARFDFDGQNALHFMKRASSYGKVRMLGSAALSLLRVANGSADAYIEQDVMLWDVAAGLALVQGAGGRFSMAPGMYNHSCNIFADNGILQLD